MEKSMNQCEYCSHYGYDEDYEDYLCDVDMDEDDLARMEERRNKNCPYFNGKDEYAIVRKQM